MVNCGDTGLSVGEKSFLHLNEIIVENSNIGIALITSFAARETFVSTMSTIYGIEDKNDKSLKENTTDNLKKEASIDDIQLSRALEIVRGISLYKNKLAIN